MQLFVLTFVASLIASVVAAPTPSTCPSSVVSTDESLEIIRTRKVASSTSPFSQGIVSGDHLYISGMLPVSPDTGKIVGEGDFAAQTRAVLNNVQAVVEAAGSNLGKVVKVNAYLTDLKNFETFNMVYAEVFGNHKPARSALNVPSILMGADIEIEAVVRL
ncbi:2-iminobutanoate/2-iminopropanoate deaminase [Hypsizygus marmoreus]|uniref:2-iminobutanoate/2-iminopropanoate deaminase n=1 Tax=Hypsizygus marmoreus TaxID=39966 RepID=A0A369J2U3_HYPMA|nr:2-iminobutanoate/2-iminopropanoate deaminase [Hypsizygus marmoreus]